MLRALIYGVGVAWGLLIWLVMFAGIWMLALPLLAGLLVYCLLALPVLKLKKAEARQRNRRKA